MPVWIGSGLDANNVHEYARAHAFVVGSSLKHDGHWARELDARRVADFVDACRALVEQQSSDNC